MGNILQSTSAPRTEMTANLSWFMPVLIGLVIVKLGIIWLRQENARGLRNGSHDSATVVLLPMWQNACSDDVCHAVATLHISVALWLDPLVGSACFYLKKCYLKQ